MVNISLFVVHGLKKYGSVQAYDDGKKKGVFDVKKWGREGGGREGCITSSRSFWTVFSTWILTLNFCVCGFRLAVFGNKRNERVRRWQQCL